MGRTILHVDMDAFFAAVEQRDHPEYAGRPVVVGAPPDQRGVVSAASYEARVFGIHSAMPSREAGRRCPHAVFVRPRMRRYEEVSRQVFAIFGRFTPLVEPLSIDEAFLDVTGARTLFGDGPAIAAKIRAAIRAETRLTASVGVATNKFLAKLASDLHKPDGLTVVPDTPDAIRAFLAPLPVGRLWGVGRTAETVLQRAGLRTMGDIQRVPASRLAALLGAAAAGSLKALASGEDERLVQTDWEEKSLSREHTFGTDVRDRAMVEATLLDLVDDVGEGLRAAGRYARTVRLKLRWADFRTLTRQMRLESPRCDDFSLRAAAHELFDALPLAHPVRLVGFGVTNLAVGGAPQLELFETRGGDLERRERLSRTVDDIRRKFGPDSIGRAPAR